MEVPLNQTDQTPRQAGADETRSTSTRRINLPQGDVREIGGPAHPEPTRYGDWERRGRCIDF